MRSGANLLATVLVGSLLLAATAATSDLPADAMRSGVPALLSKKTAKKWKAWRGPALLAFYGQGKQNMGLKQLGKEYMGKLPIGGVRPGDTALQQMFGVKPNEVCRRSSPTDALSSRRQCLSSQKRVPVSR